MPTGLSYDPQQTYFGGSAQALDQTRAIAAQQMQQGQDLAGKSTGLAAQIAQYGQLQGLTNGVNTIQRNGLDTTAVTNGAGIGAQMAQALNGYDPQRAVAMQSQAAQDMAARQALSVARSGPYAAAGVRDAVMQQGALGVQASQQAALAAAGAEAQRAQIGIQANQVANQAYGINAQLAAQERARLQQLGLAQQQMGLSAALGGSGQMQQGAQFQQQLYSGREQTANQAQLQADQFQQQMLAQQAAQNQAFVGGMIGAAGGVVGAGMMGGGGLASQLGNLTQAQANAATASSAAAGY